jgi:hypothetical protein
MKIQWLHDTNRADDLADFFLANTTKDYITDIEIEEGRAISLTQWSDNLKGILKKELIKEIPFGNVLVVTLDDQIKGYALVKIDGEKVVIEDIIVSVKGLGSDMMKIIHWWAEMKGIQKIVCHVGLNNEAAKGLMRKRGYEAQTITYVKNI